MNHFMGYSDVYKYFSNKDNLRLLRKIFLPLDEAKCMQRYRCKVNEFCERNACSGTTREHCLQEL